MHHEHRPVFERQVVHRMCQFLLEIGIGSVTRRPDRHRVIQLCFPLPKPLHLAQPIQDHRGRDRVEPGPKGGFSPEPLDSLEGPDERFLREVLGEVVVAGQPVCQPVDAVHVRVVQLALGYGVPGPDLGDHLTLVHQAPALGSLPATDSDSYLAERVPEAEGASGPQGVRASERSGYALPSRDKIPRASRSKSADTARPASSTSSWDNAVGEMPAARFVMLEIPSTRIPRARAATTSGTVDIPTASPKR